MVDDSANTQGFSPWFRNLHPLCPSINLNLTFCVIVHLCGIIAFGQYIEDKENEAKSFVGGIALFVQVWNVYMLC